MCVKQRAENNKKIYEVQKYLENIKINLKVQKYKSCRATIEP